MNEILEDLIFTCNKIETTVMAFNIYDIEVECPTAIIKGKNGKISTVYYEDGVWS